MLRALLCAIFMALPNLAFAYETQASAAYVFDYNTGAVLLEKNADQPLPPASMSKLMTLNMIFEALDDGRLTLDTKFRVSAKAAAKGGSKMFLRQGERVSIANLIKGIIIHSGNDACITVAEGMAGTEEEFARQMTDRARKLGMKGSSFANSSGWPHPNHRMSMRDLGFLAHRLLTKFPEHYENFSKREFTWDDITQRNRNPLLALGIGADGLKTGHTSEAGYGLVGSVKQGKRRIIFVITGLSSEGARAAEAERITNWAFRQFAEAEILPEQTEVAQARVWMGRSSSVGLTALGPVKALVPVHQKDQVKAQVIYEGPLEAPISKGDHIADLVLTRPGLPDQKVPLMATDDVARGGFFVRISTAARVAIRELGTQVAQVAAF